MDTKDILKKIDMLNLEPRVSLIIASYFCAKVKLGEITENTIDEEIQKYSENVKHFEFINSSKFKVALEKTGGIISINKDFLNTSKPDELIPLIFTKIEESINNKENSINDVYGNALIHIKSFQEAIKITKKLNLPCNENFESLYNLLSVTFDKDGKGFDEEISKDRGLEIMCYDVDKLVNNVIAEGRDEPEVLKNILNLYRYKVLTDKENGINVTSDKYKEDFIQVVKSIEELSKNNYINYKETSRIIDNLSQTIKQDQNIKSDIQKKENLQRNTRLYRGIMERFITKQEKLTQKHIRTRVDNLIKEKTEYDKRICCLLPEFFIRSAHIYGWTKDEFDERINTFQTTINKIRFEEMGVYTAGSVSIDEIKINSKFYLNSRGNLIKDKQTICNLARTFFHEAGHVTDSCTREGIPVREKLSRSFVNNIFYEWTNTVFERAIMDDIYSDDTAMFLSRRAGYEEMTNAGSMISAAMGLDEIKFAKLKDLGLERTKEFFDNEFSYCPDLFEKIRTTFRVPSLTLEGREAKKMYQQMYKNVYNLCIEVLDARIENDMQKVKEINNNEDYQTKQKYLLKKINSNYQKACKDFGLRKEAKNIIHNTKQTSDKIDKETIRIFGEIIREENNFSFGNKFLLEDLKSDYRKPTLKDRIKIKLANIPRLDKSSSYYKENLKEIDRD